MARVRIRKGWDEAGRYGKTIGSKYFYKQSWTPVLWDDCDDPDWFKSDGLEEITSKTERFFLADGTILSSRDIPASTSNNDEYVRRSGKLFVFDSADEFYVNYVECKKIEAPRPWKRK